MAGADASPPAGADPPSWPRAAGPEARTMERDRMAARSGPIASVLKVVPFLETLAHGHLVQGGRLEADLSRGFHGGDSEPVSGGFLLEDGHLFHQSRFVHDECQIHVSGHAFPFRPSGVFR